MHCPLSHDLSIDAGSHCHSSKLVRFSYAFLDVQARAAANTCSIADYDPIDHLNAIFSHPSTLSSVASTSDALRQYQQDLETDIVFPLTYIFYYSPRARDLGYEIKHKISVAEFLKSIITFRRKDLDSGDFLGYEDQNVRIYDQPIPEPEPLHW